MREKLTMNEGPTGPNGGCHNGCPEGTRIDLLEGEDDKRKFQ